MSERAIRTELGGVWINIDQVIAIEPKGDGSLIRTATQVYDTIHDADELARAIWGDDDGSSPPPMTEAEHAALLASFEVEPLVDRAPAKRSASRKRAAKRR